MKAFLIDPNTQSVDEIQLHGDINTAASHILEADDTLASATLAGTQDLLIVDDEAFLTTRRGFAVNTAIVGSSFAGQGLVVGLDSEGQPMAPVIDRDELAQRVRFTNH